VQTDLLWTAKGGDAKNISCEKRSNRWETIATSPHLTQIV